MAISGKYVIVQIFPTRIHGIDQLVLPLSVPAFDLLFPFDRSSNIGCCFIIYQFMNVVSGGKAVWVQFIFVLIHTFYQIIGHAGIYRGIVCI